MDKRNKIIFLIIILISIVAVGFCIYKVLNNKNEIVNVDAKKFRNEYMELNDKVNELTNKDYADVFISESNTFKYVDSKEAIDVLKNKTGILYFGYATCSDCRLLVPILSEIAEKNNKTIYYLDVQKIRSSFVVEEGSIKKIKDGTKEYYEIIKILKDELEDLYLTDEAGNMYNTKEKNFFIPSLFAVSNGKITGKLVEKISENSENLTEEEKGNLKNKITKLIEDNEVNEICNPNKEC